MRSSRFPSRLVFHSLLVDSYAQVSTLLMPNGHSLVLAIAIASLKSNIIRMTVYSFALPPRSANTKWIVLPPSSLKSDSFFSSFLLEENREGHEEMIEDWEVECDDEHGKEYSQPSVP